jgi:bifunctional UDP-N-acetylglucosamine pyrophosphorylase/glucosamine-1-phosphate N-acetyltransferase
MLSIIILAAGAGTRMKSNKPKVLHNVCNKPMLCHIIEESQKVTDEVEVVLYHKKEMVEDVIKKYNTKIVTQDHLNFPGTGGAIKCTNPIKDKVLILNGDMPLITENDIKAFLEVDADIVMSVIKLDNPDGYGRVVIEDGEVQKIVEQKDASTEELKIEYVNAGVYLINKELLDKFLPLLSNDNAQKEYYLTDIIEMARKENHSIKALEVKEESFKGVNSKFDLANAEKIMSDRIKEKWMKAGVIMHLPDTIFIDSESEFIGECEIDSGVSITNSIIEESHIKTNSIIEEAKIIDSEIGPMARIRPQSEIEKSKIGNFVEVKKSKLYDVKAGHLSYLGDSEIDSGTNIGAGTITCNYDGVKKYKTKIGKNVFIGSDSQLVAPITIEDNTMIAAGSTITKNVKEGELAITRTPQTSIKGFFFKFFNKK